MVYQNLTYQRINARMIQRISQKYPDLDIRQGSIVFNAIASAAMQTALIYTELDAILNQSFVQTASRGYLYKQCSQMGIDIAVFAPTTTFVKGQFDIEIPLDSRWSCDKFTYIVVKSLPKQGDKFTYQLQCQQLGSAPNAVTGDLTPIDFIQGDLKYSKITQVIVQGEDQSTQQQIRDYYFNTVASNSINANKDQYLIWCEEETGVGNAKVFPLWDGPNTVKVSILNTENRKASDQLVQDFQNKLDPGVTGMGDGLAPIGAFVTVSTGTQVPINITGTVKLQEGYTGTEELDKAVTKFLSDIAYKKSVVPYMNLGAVLVDVPGVDYVSDLRINGIQGDFGLFEEDIPVMGTTNWTVSK